jgi:hypothetical protein
MKKSSLVRWVICLAEGAFLSTALYAQSAAPVRSADQQKPAVYDEKKDPLNINTPSNVDPLKDADNTDRNKRDRNNATFTPGDQGNTDGDEPTLNSMTQ